MTMCEKCFQSEGINKLVLENGMYADVCDTCHDKIFYEMSRKGIKKFVQWSDMNYTNTKELAYGLFDMEEVVAYYGGGEDTEYVNMFTFGILKYPHNIRQEGGIDIVENSTVSGQKMFSTGSFPVTLATNNENDKVYGTLFKVPKHIVVHSYDSIEGYSPNRPKTQNMYNRELVEVTTPNGEKVMANMYIATTDYFRGWYASHYNIPTGNFDDMYKYVEVAKKKGV